MKKLDPNLTDEQLIELGKQRAERYNELRRARRAKKRELEEQQLYAAHPELRPDPNAPVEYRVCSICGERKPITEFHMTHFNKSGPKPWKYCKACHMKLTSEKNLEKVAKQNDTVTAGKEKLEQLRLQEVGLRKCKVCMCIKPLSEFKKDLRIIKSTGQIRYETTCKQCREVIRKSNANDIAFVRGKTKPLVPPLIMNPKKPELAVIDKYWLLDPADEEHWELDPRVKALVQELIHLPLTSNEDPKLMAAPKYEELPKGKDDNDGKD